MFGMATGGAAEHGRPTRLCVDVAACTARLRAIGGMDLDERAPRPRELVAEHRAEAGPSSIGNAARTVAAHHAGNVELLDHDHAVALGVPVTEDVKEVLALPTYLAVQDGDANPGLFPVLGSFLAACADTLCMSEPPHGGLVEAWGGDEATVRVADRVGDATIKGDDWAGTRNWVRNFNLTDDQREPLTPSLLPNSTCLRDALERTVDNDAHGAELREVECRAVEAPDFRVWLAERRGVVALPFPSGRTTGFLEAALPGLVQLDEELCGNIAWHISKPWQFGPELGEFLALVERRRVAAIALGPGQAHAPLLVGEVPEEAQGALPSGHPGDLRGARVDAKAERVANQHGTSIPRVFLHIRRLP